MEAKFRPSEWASDCLYVDYLRQFEVHKRPALDRPGWQVLRKFLKLISILACVDLFARIDIDRGEEESSESATTCRLRPYSRAQLLEEPLLWLTELLFHVRHIRLSPGRRREGFLWLSDTLVMHYYVFMVYIIFNLAYQYPLDIDRLRLIQTHMTANQSREPAKLAARVQALELRINETSRALDNIGAPHSYLTIIIECLYLWMMMLATVTFYMLYLRFKFVVPLDTKPLRALLTYDEERKFSDQLVFGQVLRFIESSRIFAKMALLGPLATGSRRRHSQVKGSFYGPNLGQGQHLKSQVSARRQSLGTKPHFETSQVLLNLYASGALHPFNESAKWIQKRTGKILSFFTLVSLYTIFFYVGVISFMTGISLDTKVNSKSFLVLYLLFIILIIAGNSLGLFGTCVYSVSIDQVMLVHKLHQMIQVCINKNELEFARLLVSLAARPRQGSLLPLAEHESDDTQTEAEETDHKWLNVAYVARYRTSIALIDPSGSTLGRPPDIEHRPPHERRPLHMGATTNLRDSPAPQGLRVSTNFEATNCVSSDSPRRSMDELPIARHDSQWDTHRKRMNTNLLFVLMQYKMFVAQYYPAKRLFEVIIIQMSTLFMCLPVITKLHIHYLQMLNTYNNLGIWVTVLSVSALVPGWIILSPVCSTHCRCVDLYKCLSSLNAHIVGVERETDQYGGVYDRHSVALLLKELRNPQQFQKKFEPRLFGVSATYKAWLKMHFWYGFLLISILCHSKPESGDLLKSLLGDPLHLL